MTLVVVERSGRGCDAAAVRALAESLLVATWTAGVDDELARLVPATGELDRGPTRPDVVVSDVGATCTAAAVDDARGALGALPAGHRFWVRRVDEGLDASAEVLGALRAAGLVAGIHGRVVSVGGDGAVTIACAGRVSVLPLAAATRVTVVAGSLDDLPH